MKLLNLFVTMITSLCLASTSFAQSTPGNPDDNTRVAESYFNQMKLNGGRAYNELGRDISFHDVLNGLSGKVTYVPDSTSRLHGTGAKFEFSSADGGKNVIVKGLTGAKTIGRRIVTIVGDAEQDGIRIRQTMQSLEQQVAASLQLAKIIKRDHRSPAGDANLGIAFIIVSSIFIVGFLATVCIKDTRGWCAIYVGTVAVILLGVAPSLFLIK